MTQLHEPASVVAARQLAMEAREAHGTRGPVRGPLRGSAHSRSGARRVAAARARRDADQVEVPAAS
ncbi:hypothetical protein TEK04_20870 [Klenkia sp. LSe6-5]|uniref:Uncharacterized protein n=1 Tax=Klenkia sesuvii TaxID=3103137 RepID=A0ABU8DZR6_9ACTN